MTILYIDTRDNQKNCVRLQKGTQEFIETSDITQMKADGILLLIDQVLKKSKTTLQDIDKVYCEKGPGSFTGLRVGFAVANTLALALSISLNDNEVGTIDTPQYL